jgi:hypothetical protein
VGANGADVAAQPAADAGHRQPRRTLPRPIGQGMGMVMTARGRIPLNWWSDTRRRPRAGPGTLRTARDAASLTCLLTELQGRCRSSEG